MKIQEIKHGQRWIDLNNAAVTVQSVNEEENTVTVKWINALDKEVFRTYNLNTFLNIYGLWP